MKNNFLLVTGGFGFLGRNVARYFSDLGYQVFGIGHGHWTTEESMKCGFLKWYEGDITVENLKNIELEFSLVVHCGGSGSVAYSISNPYQDFSKTVCGTAAVLEYIRLHNPKARLIYPSSPAVHGEHKNCRIKEEASISPASPYGHFKYMAEYLCETYRTNYHLDIVILRLFSVYGEGLTKQLLWDACNKITSGNDIVFWGGGYETRDWIHVTDVLSLIKKVSECDKNYPKVINAGSGVATPINNVLNLLADNLGYKSEIKFNNIVRAGDPLYYWADITKALDIGWKPVTGLQSGIKRYAEWFLSQKR